MAETASITAVGSNLVIFPPNLYQAWPPGLQIALDGGSYVDAEYYKLIAVNYPGTFKLKTTAAANIRYYNYKTIAEATSLVGETVVIGEVATA